MNAEQPPTSKKRKAEEPLPSVEEVRENDRPTTPPSSKSKSDVESKEHEKTPGRVGPIKPRSFSTSPNIQPFKGPPGKKVRKTRHEKDEEYKQFIRDNEKHIFHEYVNIPYSKLDRSILTLGISPSLYVCFDKGPNGSPTYDSSGFQLDYNKVADWMKPRAYNKRSMVNGMEKHLERVARESKRMAEIFFAKGEAPEQPEYGPGKDYWKDRVSKDLNIPWHKIEVKHFEEWEKKGFKKARKGEYEIFSEEERKRMGRLHDGCTLRK